MSQDDEDEEWKMQDDFSKTIQYAIPYLLFADSEFKNLVLAGIEKLIHIESTKDKDEFYKHVEDFEHVLYNYNHGVSFFHANDTQNALISAYQDQIQDLQEQIDELKAQINVTKGNACVICGTIFDGRKGAKYCSSACKQEAYRKRKGSK